MKKKNRGESKTELKNANHITENIWISLYYKKTSS